MMKERDNVEKEGRGGSIKVGVKKNISGMNMMFFMF